MTHPTEKRGGTRNSPAPSRVHAEAIREDANRMDSGLWLMCGSKESFLTGPSEALGQNYLSPTSPSQTQPCPLTI